MRLLLDTHLLLWIAQESGRLRPRARALIAEPGNALLFSAASLWEIAIKHGLHRRDFVADPHRLHQTLLDNGYTELAVTGRHGLAVGSLPLLHKDPFDRILVAQALVEDITLLTSDPMVARYPGPVLFV